MSAAYVDGYPTCAVCHAPVERIAERDAPSLSDAGRRLVSAYCHGAVDNVYLSTEDLMAMMKGKVWFTIAFSAQN